MNLTLEKKVPLAFLFALLLLVVTAGLSYRSMKGLIGAFEWEQHSYTVLTHLEETLTTLVDAETGGRGFVITGNEAFLEPFNRAKRNLEREIPELRQLTEDNPRQRQRLNRLEQLANERMKRIQTGIDLRRNQSLDAVLKSAKTTQSTALMDSVRQLIAEMKNEEIALLHQREERLQISLRQTLIVILAGSGLGIAMLGFANLAILREIGRRRKAEIELQRANEELEQRVAARTQDLAQANQELRFEMDRRARAEEAERRQREWWRVTLASIGDAVITTDIEGRINYLNQIAQQLTGWPLEEAQGHPLPEVFQIVNETNRQPIENPVTKVLREGVIVGLANHTMLLSRDGRDIPIDDSGAPIRDDEGNVLGTALIFRDVTAARRAEETLRENRERLGAALMASETGTFRWDLRDNTVDSDESLPRLFGMPQNHRFQTMDEFIARIAPDYRAAARDCFERCAREGGDFDMEFLVNWPDETMHWLVTKGKTFLDARQQPLTLTGACVDITERKRSQLERELLITREQAARKQAEEANQLKDEFVATISHELRTPLNAILGWARLLRTNKLDPAETANAVETIERSAENQARLIDDLLDISRLVTGKLRLDIGAIDPRDVVQAAMEIVHPAAAAKGITIEADLDPAASTISGDSNRLQQVLWNLLSNAIKFTPPGGKINLRLANNESQIVITVSDNGDGISPEFLPHIFDRFRQADSSSVRKHGGLGLGLAIVRQLVEMHGGTIKAESQGAGKGATFTLQLPIRPLQITNPRADGEPPLSAWKLPAQAEPILEGLSILVVDDEMEARQLLTQILTSYGATVSSAGSSAETLEFLSQQKPDLIISDIGMPDEDGYSLIRRIRDLNRDADGANVNIRTPAIALTAYAHPQDRIRALAAGFQQHLPKPVEPVELITIIASLTGRLSR